MFIETPGIAEVNVINKPYICMFIYKFSLNTAECPLRLFYIFLYIAMGLLLVGESAVCEWRSISLDFP